MLFKSRLGARVFSRSLLLLLVALSLNALVYTFIAHRSQLDDRERDFVRAVTYLEPSIIKALWQVDAESISLAVTSIGAIPGVARVFVQAKYHLELIAEEFVLPGHENTPCTKSIYKSFKDELYKGERLNTGTMQICYSRELVKPASETLSWIPFLQQSSSALVIALIFLMMIYRAVIRPVAELTRQIKEGDAILGNSLKRDAWDADDEIDTLYRDFQDRTKRLKEEYEIATATYDAIADGIIVTDENFLILRQSSTIDHLFETPGDPATPRYLNELIPQSGLDNAENIIQFTRNDHQLEAFLFRLGTGGYACIVSDVTERNRIMQESFSGQKLQALGMLSGGIAHDFNNILAIIAGCADLAQLEASDNPNVLKHLTAIDSAINTATALTGKLRAFSNKGAAYASIIDINTILENIGSYSGSIVLPPISLNVFNSTTAKIKVDQGNLESAILNLVLNAVDAIGAGKPGSIEIAASDQYINNKHLVCLCVKDNGCGIPADILKRVNDPFFTTKPKGKGSGLGLAMIESFAEQSEGYFRISSQEGEGTEACLYLPAYYGAEPSPKLDLGLTRNASAINPSDYRLLVVDDEELIASSLSKQLSQYGYRVDFALDPSVFIAEPEKVAQYQLIISDILMGELTGAQMYRAVREALGASCPPFIFISGNVPRAVSEDLASLNQYNILSKPFKPAQLKTVIDQVLTEVKNGV